MIEKQEKEFYFDGIWWELDSMNLSERQYTISKVNITHPIFKNPVDYLYSLAHNLAFIAWIGCTERCFVWDVYPIIKMKEGTSGNPYLDIDETKIVAHRIDDMIDSIQLVTTSQKEGIEKCVRYPVPVNAGIAVFKPANKENEKHELLCMNPILNIFPSDIEPYFWRIEGEAYLVFDDFSIIHSTAMENAIRSLKENMIGSVIASGIRANEYYKKMTKDEVLRYTKMFDFNCMFVGDPQIDYEDFGKVKGVNVKFYISRSKTTDGFPMLAVSPNYGGNIYNKLKPNMKRSESTFSSVIVQNPEDIDPDMKIMLNFYIATRLSNANIDHLEKHWVIPFIMQEENLEYHKDSPNMYDMVFFNKHTASFHFFEGKNLKETDLSNISDSGIRDLYIPVKHSKMSFLKSVFGNYLISRDYVIKDKYWQNGFSPIVKITDYYIPFHQKSITDDSLRVYLKRIQEDIKNTLEAHPTWDYIPIQGFDILDWTNPYHIDFKDPIECAISMIRYHELKRYSVIWGDFSKLKESDRPESRKQIHNHPVFPVGGRCVWIFN